MSKRLHISLLQRQWDRSSYSKLLKDLEDPRMTNPAPNHWRRTERLDVRLSPFERTLLKTISRTFKGIVKLTLSDHRPHQA